MLNSANHSVSVWIGQFVASHITLEHCTVPNPEQQDPDSPHGLENKLKAAFGNLLALGTFKVVSLIENDDKMLKIVQQIIACEVTKKAEEQLPLLTQQAVQWILSESMPIIVAMVLPRLAIACGLSGAIGSVCQLTLGSFGAVGVLVSSWMCHRNILLHSVITSKIARIINTAFNSFQHPVKRDHAWFNKQVNNEILAPALWPIVRDIKIFGFPVVQQ